MRSRHRLADGCFFGLVAGALVLVLNDALAVRVVWLAENYRDNGPRLLDQQILDVPSGVSMWGWAGIIAGSVGLTLGLQPVRNQIIAAGSWLASKTTHPLLLPAERWGGILPIGGGRVGFYSPHPLVSDRI